AEDIAAMGATDLDEVLETVPGLHVAIETQGYAPIYVIRGLYFGFNPQVLMLINGVSMTTVFTGNRGAVWGGMPVENIARIEVLRGPGSALYGAEAFAGVINIITKSASDINGTQVGARAGTFHNGDGWMLHGGQWAGTDVAAYLRIGSTKGNQRTVEADAQTGWDGVFGTNASHAPGPVNNGRTLVDGMLDFSKDKWRLHFGLKDRSNYGNGFGLASALDPTGNDYSQNFNGDLTYDDQHWTDDLALNVQASFMHYKEFSAATLFPAGTNIGTGTFEDGMIGNPQKWESHMRLGGSLSYTGLNGHRVRLGSGYERESLYRVHETKNFNPNYTPIGTGSTGDVIDVSDTVPFMNKHTRRKFYVYGQDEWSLAKDVTLTAGVRHDRYSDFGTTVNPRAALVWEAAYNVTAKLLYGSAFRPPSMAELYAINNPIVQGNELLKPEKIKTTEAAVSWQVQPSVQLGVNLFHYDMSDIIRLVDFVYQNTGRQTGNGLEFEAAWDASSSVRLSGNYSFQYSIDKAVEHDAGNAPHNQAYARADWRFMSGWAVDAQANWIGERSRVTGDTRAPLKGYTTLDLTLRTDKSTKGWNFAMSIRNLFNADAREPSPYDFSAAGHPFISLPNDFPLAGRYGYIEVSHAF
ncbi:TonB-dependent receptor, partial [Aquabacterium sp.]|uniref:TonB-dependent receptor plug domain-containing protein n=1 Tax=Aquabacterium sp. TaxID=1872578 RepID=UPI0025C52241